MLMLLFDNQTKVSYLIAIKQKCHIFGSESWRSWVCACIHVYVAYTCVYEERWKCAYVHTSHMSVCWPWHIQENGNHSAPFKPISGPAQAYQVELVREEPVQLTPRKHNIDIMSQRMSMYRRKNSETQVKGKWHSKSSLKPIVWGWTRGQRFFL